MQRGSAEKSQGLGQMQRGSAEKSQGLGQMRGGSAGLSMRVVSGAGSAGIFGIRCKKCRYFWDYYARMRAKQTRTDGCSFFLLEKRFCFVIFFVLLQASIADTPLKRCSRAGVMGDFIFFACPQDSLSEGWRCDFRGYKQLKRTLFIQNVS